MLKNNLIGHRFGSLVAIEYIPGTRGKKGQWKCRCDCGNDHYAGSENLRRNNVRSCGCLQKKLISDRMWQGFEEISLSYWHDVERNALKRNLTFTVTIKEAWEKFLLQNKHCALSGESLTFARSQKGFHKNQTASLDRIDNKLGYVEGNIQWIHKRLNRLKNDFCESELLELVNKIYNFKINLEEYKYPDWANYFIGLAFVISQRSKDIQTKHGCIITDKHNHIIGTGYNSFPHGLCDNLLPKTRPEKYSWILHAEENAITNCILSPHLMDNSVAYITGQPCNHCAQLLWQNNVKKWFIAKRQGSKLENEESKKQFDIFVEQTGVNLVYMDFDLSWIRNLKF